MIPKMKLLAKTILPRKYIGYARRLYRLWVLLRFGGDSREAKRWHEIRYWREKQSAELRLSNRHYEYFYTTHFNLEKGFYTGKRILDIGCGPRGSLEWADNASERVGLDPLADTYGRLGSSEHKMTYLTATSEAIPFPDGYFDVVSSFNSLDHVDDLDRTVKEIIRVIRPGGLFLLLTDVNHEPTITEPLSFSWDVVDRFSPALRLIEARQYEKPRSGLYQSIQVGVPYDHSNAARRYGILSAKFIRESGEPFSLHRVNAGTGAQPSS